MVKTGSVPARVTPMRSSKLTALESAVDPAKKSVYNGDCKKKPAVDPLAKVAVAHTRQYQAAVAQVVQSENKKRKELLGNFESIERSYGKRLKDARRQAKRLRKLLEDNDIAVPTDEVDAIGGGGDDDDDGVDTGADNAASEVVNATNNDENHGHGAIRHG